MGLFDYLTVDCDLPDGFKSDDFQTKSLDPMMARYRLAADGRLYLRSRDGAESRIAHHGDVDFYGFEEHEDGSRTWHNYTARFTDGECVRILAHGAETFDASAIETAEILSDPEAMAAIEQGMKEVAAGIKGKSLEELEKELGLAPRRGGQLKGRIQMAVSEEQIAAENERQSNFRRALLGVLGVKDPWAITTWKDNEYIEVIRAKLFAAQDDVRHFERVTVDVNHLNRDLKRQRDQWERAANEWEQKYEELKAKYEPGALVES